METDQSLNPMDLQIEPQKEDYITKKEHSKIGIGSFVCALASIAVGVLAIGSIILAGMFSISSGGEPNGAVLMLGGFMIFGTAFFQLIGIVLGIIGILSKNTKKVYAILGLTISGSGILLLGATMLIGK